MTTLRRQSAVLLAAMASLAHAAGPTTAPATAPTTAPTTQPQVELVREFDRLASADAIERIDALESIVDMGSNVVDPLKVMIASTDDLEQRTSAQAALAQIMENAAVGPTMITLHLNNATPAKVIAELSKQAKLPIRLENSDAGKKVSVDIQNQPFWEAVRQISAATGCSLQSSGRTDLTFNQSSRSYQGPHCVDGPFMIIARSINMSSSVHLANQNNVSRNMSMQFSCFTEPKLQISMRPYYVRLTEAVDDQGRSLVLPSASMYDGYSDANQPMWDANAQLKVPEPGATKIARLRGSMRLLAAIRSQTIEIDDITSARNVTKTAGPYSIMVKDCTTSGNATTLNVVLTFTSRRGGQNLVQQIKLLDANGNALQQNETSGSGGMNRLEYRLVYRSNSGTDKAPSKPAKLVLNVPVETRPLEFNFEFKDLPLPR